MNESNPFHGTGLKTMQRTGLTSEEQAISQGEHLSFEEKVERLRLGAEAVVRSTRFALAIEMFSKQNGGLEKLTEKACEEFLADHPDCPFEPGMVFAIAEKMESMKGARSTE